MLSREALLQAIPTALQTVELADLGPKEQGKVRDIYQFNGHRLLITTDRVSAFDRVLGLIPFKGQILNQLSAWWFEQTRDIIGNHLIDVPDPNVTIAQNAKPLPVEVVVRGYITGVTKTSLWTLYAQGERQPYGIPLPHGLKKNDPLPEPIITPTSKAVLGGHDERLTRTEILKRGLVPASLWAQVEQTALALFKRGQELAGQAGLVLVDTKYEFGLVDDRLVLIDEIHTPDSSRFWMSNTYKPGHEPEHFDKEYLRQWFADQNYRGDGQPPEMPPDFVAKVAARYIVAFERLTYQEFVPGEQPAAERIARNIAKAAIIADRKDGFDDRRLA